MSFAVQYGPWALILGASEGTGRAFARKIAANGVPSILVARREKPLLELAGTIRAETGVECIAASIDLAAPDAFDQIVSAIGSREVGLFVSNAGADPHGSYFLDSSMDVWLDQIQRNIITMARCCHHLGGLMRQRRRGGLLLVNSGACYGGSSFMAAYSGTKAFTLCFGESLWAELRRDGVDVLTLVMSLTDTPALRELLVKKGLPVPAMAADAEAVAEIGLARLAHGPVHNWGFEDEAPAHGLLAAADRRKRVLTIEAATARVFGKSAES
jgi:uncharacterized protein